MDCRTISRYLLPAVVLFSGSVVGLDEKAGDSNDYKSGWPPEHVEALEVFDRCAKEEVSYGIDKRIEHCTRLHGKDIADLWKAQAPTISAGKRLTGLISDFENMVNYESANKYRPDIPPQCNTNDKFKSLLSTRFDLFLFHHNLKNGYNFELLFNRDSRFLGEFFIEVYNAGINLDAIDYSNQKRYMLFVEELLAYHDKIIRTNAWQEKFDSILAGNKWAISKAHSFHKAGFPMHEDECYRIPNVFSHLDGGTEGWFYSFWIRRYKEGNFGLAKILLEWGAGRLVGVENNKAIDIQQFKDKYLAGNTSERFLGDQQLSSATLRAGITESCEKLPAPEYPVIQSAYPGDDSTLEFRPFIDIDWEQKAPGNFKRIDTDNLHFEDLAILRKKRNMWGNAEFVFQSPLDCTAEYGFPYLVSSAGIDPIVMSNFEGTARFGSDSKAKFYAPIYYGNIVAKTTSGDKTEGGFVVLAGSQLEGDYSVNAEIEFSTTVTDGKLSYRHQSGDKSYELTMSQEHPEDVVASYRFRLDGDDFIFVQWSGDNSCNYGCCFYNYSLFRVSESLELVATNRFGCDI